MKYKKSIIIIFLLLIVFCIVIGNPIRNIENLDNAYRENNILGGAIITLQTDLKKINEDLETLTKNFESSYPAKALIITAKTLNSNLYHNINDLIPIITSITEADILQAKDSSSTKITNPNIKAGSEDMSWKTFINILKILKQKLNELIQQKNAYLANVPTPLPEKIDQSIKDSISIFKKIDISINIINKYINNIIIS